MTLEHLLFAPSLMALNLILRKLIICPYKISCHLLMGKILNWYRQSPPIKMQIDPSKPLPRINQYPINKEALQGIKPIVDDYMAQSLIMWYTSPCNRLPRWLSGKESTCQCRRYGFSSLIGKLPWMREWQPTLVFLPAKSHGQRSLVGYSPWGHKRVWHDLVAKQQQMKDLGNN